MSEAIAQVNTPVVESIPTKEVKVKKTSTKPKPSHPKFFDMITEALKKLNEKTGSSRIAIVKYIMANYSIDEKTANKHTKVALKNGVKNNNFKQSTGNGVNGSFKIGDAVKLKEKAAEKEAKRKAKAALKPKKVVAKKETKKLVKKVAKPSTTGSTKKIVKKTTDKTKTTKEKKTVSKETAKKNVTKKAPVKIVIKKTVKPKAEVKSKADAKSKTASKTKTVKSSAKPKVVSKTKTVAKPKTASKPKA